MASCWCGTHNKGLGVAFLVGVEHATRGWDVAFLVGVEHTTRGGLGLSD